MFKATSLKPLVLLWGFFCCLSTSGTGDSPGCCSIGLHTSCIVGAVTLMLCNPVHGQQDNSHIKSTWKSQWPFPPTCLAAQSYTGIEISLHLLFYFFLRCQCASKWQFLPLLNHFPHPSTQSSLSCSTALSRTRGWHHNCFFSSMILTCRSSRSTHKFRSLASFRKKITILPPNTANI